MAPCELMPLLMKEDVDFALWLSDYPSSLQILMSFRLRCFKSGDPDGATSLPVHLPQFFLSSFYSSIYSIHIL